MTTERVIPTMAKMLAAAAIVVTLLLLSLPRVGSRPTAPQHQCVNNLKQIALALGLYATEHGALPPAYTTDANGKHLHSWRTLILPYLEQKELFDSIDFSKPWDDPANAKALATPLQIFRCPVASLNDNCTTYLAVVTPNSCLRPEKPRPLAEIKDGTDQTLMIVEVDKEHAVPWMSPVDADERLVLALAEPKSKTPHPRGFNGAFVGGEIDFISSGTPVEQLRAMISIAGNDKVDDLGVK